VKSLLSFYVLLGNWRSGSKPWQHGDEDIVTVDKMVLQCRNDMQEYQPAAAPCEKLMPGQRRIGDVRAHGGSDALAMNGRRGHSKRPNQTVRIWHGTPRLLFQPADVYIHPVTGSAITRP
jgi:hypothetical protein